MRRAGLVAAGLALALVGCTQPSPSPTASGTLSWTPCRVSSQCATLDVPLDASHPDAGSIDLALVRRPATGPRQGTLLLVPGGPGGSGLDEASSFDATGLEGFDIVSWDPRGVGSSTRVECADGAEADALNRIDPAPSTHGGIEALAAASETLGRSCLAHSPTALVEHVSSVESAADVESIRAALGADRLDVLAVSYGSVVASLYAAAHPERVGRLVLDSPSDLTRASVPQAVGFERSFNAFAGWCAQRSDCRWGRSADAVSSGLASWIRGLGTDATSGRPTSSTAARGIATLLYAGERGRPALKTAIEDAQDGRPASLLAASDAFIGRDADGRYGSLLWAGSAATCADDPRKGFDEALAAWNRARSDAPLFGELLGPDLGCVRWPTSAHAWLPVAPTTPTLLIAATNDPATPYEWAQADARAMPASTLLTVDAAAHGQVGSDACAREAMVGFVRDGASPGRNTCPA